MGSEGSYDVFLSYARSDGAAAAELNSWLRAQGLQTFFDRCELRPGLRWIPALEDAIGRSDAVAILVGRQGLGNTQQYERELALVRQTCDDGFPVIPVLMPGCENPPTGFLQLLTWVDLSQGDSVLQQTDSLEILRGAIHRQAVSPSSIRSLICPYKGLEPFREEDAAFFCGRDDAIRDLVSQVQTYPFVAVVGPSGSGKSSLVFAGLLPKLRQQPQTMMWDVVWFRPGPSPLRALAGAFGAAPERAGPAAIDSYLEGEASAYRTGDADKLSRIVNDRLNAAPEKPDRLLIYVDQWEELYAMAPRPEETDRLQQHSDDVKRFIELLVAAASGSRSRATVVLTARADFYASLIRPPLLSALLPRQQVNIPPMNVSDLRSAIETPATKAGLSFAPPALVDQILVDVGTQEGRLPLLQFALKETWEQRTGDQLTAEAYTTVGGVTGAIEKTAQDAYNRLNPAQQEAARLLFLRLVTPGEGQEDTRARSPIPDDPQQREIIDLFSNPKTRLLVTGYTALRGAAQAGGETGATVEVAHEALIRRWQTLRTWVDGNREKLRARTAILRARAEWEENSQNDKFLLDPGVWLERGRDLLDNPGDVAVDDIRAYVGLSIDKEKRRLDAEREAALAEQRRIADAERRAKEAAEEAARQAEARARAEEVARRKLRNRLIQTAAVGSVALGAFALSAVEWKLASQNANLASQNESKAESLAKERQLQLERANKALAEGILADLDLKNSDEGLTVRQRNALWKLATEDEAVKGDFISALSTSPEEVGRVAYRFGEVSRSVRLQWPSPTETRELFFVVLQQIGKTTDPDALQALAQALQALAANLTEAQAQQALNPVLQQIGKMANPYAPYALQALAQALQALPVKLTEAQAQQALNPVLQQIGKTADSAALQALAQALQALAAKLTETQAQQALNPVLRQIGKTTDSTVLQALAQAFQALAAKLTEAQAQQALNPVLQQIGKTTDPDTLQALAQAFQVLAAKLTEAQAQQALNPVLQQIGKTTDPDALQALAQAFQALAAKLTEAQAQQVLNPVLQQIGKTTDSAALQALTQALQALPAKLTEAQAQQALNPVLQQIGKTTDPAAPQALAQAFQALAAKLTEAQAQQAFNPVLQQIGRTNNSAALQALAQALQALAAKLTEAQAQQALNPVLQQIGKTTDPAALQALAQALQALAGKLTEAQAQQALNPVLQQIGKTANSAVLQALAQALQALAAKLTEAQAQRALDPVLQQIGKTTDPAALQALAQAFQALAAKLTEAQAQQALNPVLQQIGKTANSAALQAPAQALQALAAKLTEAQAQRALDPVLQQIGKTTDPAALQALAQAFQALAAKLTEAQAQQTLNPVLQQIGKTAPDAPYALQALAQALQALPAKLTEAQAQQAFNPVLQQIGETNNPDALQTLAQALQALAAKLTETQAQQALNPVLQQIGKTTDSTVLQALAQAFQELAAKLTEAQAQQALNPVLQQIGKTTDSTVLQALAQALQALAAKLTEAQAQQAFNVAASSLAWAATELEAVEWARALVALPSRATDRDGTRELVAAIVYPTAAGPATEVLLEAIRARHPDEPANQAGTTASLAWIAEKYPDLVRRPICPPPPQPTSLSGLKCPVAKPEALTNAAGSVPKDTKAIAR